MLPREPATGEGDGCNVGGCHRRQQKLAFVSELKPASPRCILDSTPSYRTDIDAGTPVIQATSALLFDARTPTCQSAMEIGRGGYDAVSAKGEVTHSTSAITFTSSRTWNIPRQRERPHKELRTIVEAEHAVRVCGGT